MKRAIKSALQSNPKLLNKLRSIQFAVQGKSGDKHRVVTRLESHGKRRGHVLISLANEPFLLRKGEPVSHDHTHDWESVCIAETWRNLGFAVDFVRFSNQYFVPDRPYDYCIDARLNLERFAPHLPESCTKVMHIDTCHWKFYNDEQQKRLDAIEARRGTKLSPAKMLPENHGIETADIATMLGNDFTAQSFAFAGKEIIRTPISTTDIWDWPEGKDWEKARRRFLWFGSAGLVHKGLDLVLEAFAQLPDYHLTVCGPISGEKDFEDAYRKELYETSNIETRGWTDIHSADWLNLCLDTGAVIYPSSSEGGGGSVITCMHAGILPVVTPSASVDIEDFGINIAAGTVEATIAAAHEAANLPPSEFETRTRTTHEYARKHHTRETFEESYYKAAESLLKLTNRS